MGQLPTVILCDLPNVARHEFIKGGMDFVGNKRMIGCLDNIYEYATHVLGVEDHDKLLFGDTFMYDHSRLLQAFDIRDWKYVPCPAAQKTDEATGLSRTVSSTDEALKQACGMFMTSGIYGHYVFISDDGDFIPEMEACIKRGYEVTLFVSGMYTHKGYMERLAYLKGLGIDVIPLLSFINPAYLKTKPAHAEHMAERIEKALAVQPQPIHLPTLAYRTPEWIVNKPPASPVERFERRYGKPEKDRT
jgi:hypothetical protein